MSTNVIGRFTGLRRALARAAAAALTPHDIGPGQFAVMRELRRVGHASQASLARELDQDPAALGRAIDVLEERGWVQREPSSTDRRRKEARLTAEGERAFARLSKSWDAFTARVDAALTPAEGEQFGALADKLVAALQSREDRTEAGL